MGKPAITKWLKNIENFSASGCVGSCPFCGSADTDYCCTVIESETHFGYGDLWCNDCKRGYHISRMQVPDDAKIGTAPRFIRY